MVRKRLALEMGMGTDLHGEDYTKASVRAVRDALWHNSLSVVPALGYHRDAMLVDVTVGVMHPEKVDTAEVAKVLPYGVAQVKAVHGGLDVRNDDDTNTTVVANAAVVVSLDVEVAGSAAGQTSGDASAGAVTTPSGGAS